MPKITPYDTLCIGIPRVGSEQTDPLHPLPTTSFSWMGFRIAPSNLSELIGWWFKHGSFFIPFKPINLFNGFGAKTHAKSWRSIGCWMQQWVLSKSEVIDR